MVCRIRGNYDSDIVYETLQQETRKEWHLAVIENKKHCRAREEALDEHFKNAYY